MLVTSQDREGNKKAAYFVLSDQHLTESPNTSSVPVHTEAANSSPLEGINGDRESFSLVVLLSASSGKQLRQAL
jgi:hypothetical protein